MVGITDLERYWVVGGEYIDTKFKTLVPGTELEEYGPFDTNEEAEEKWNSLSWKRVDNCHCRYTVQVELELDCTQQEEANITKAAEKLGMTTQEFVIYAMEKYFEDHPLTREDFEDISE